MPDAFLRWTPAAKTERTVTSYAPRRNGTVITTGAPGTFPVVNGEHRYTDTAGVLGASYDILTTFSDNTTVTSNAQVYAASTPTGLTISGKTSTSMTLNWTVPASSAHTGFTVYAFDPAATPATPGIGVFNPEYSEDVTAERRSFQFNNFTAGRSYRLGVAPIINGVRQTESKVTITEATIGLGFLDDFSTKNTARWTLTGGADITGGNLVMPANGYPPAGSDAYTSDFYNLSSGTFTADVASVVSTVTGDALLEVGLTNATDTDSFRFLIYQTTAAATTVEAGYRVAGGAFQTTFGHTRARHLRIRPVGANVLWETSPDATTWTTIRTMAAASVGPLTSLRPYFKGRGTGTPAYTVNSTEVTATSAPTAPTTPTTPLGKVKGVYRWENGSNTTAPGIAVGSVDTRYNLMYLFVAHHYHTAFGQNVVDDFDGRVRWTYQQPNLTQMAAWRAAGRRIILSVGGSNSSIKFVNRTMSTAFCDSIDTINTGWGGTRAAPVFDGIDFNNFEQSVAPNLTEHRWISQELRRRFGTSFLITSPPAPWDVTDKAFCQSMLASGDMNYCAPQYYEGGNASPARILGTSGQYDGSVPDWVANVAGGDPSKIVVGFGIGNNPPEYMSVSSCVSTWNSIKTQFPTIGGLFVWSTDKDAATGWAGARDLIV